MALPDIEKITQELNKRFAAPLPEFYKRRIIFWYDEDREFEDKVEDLALDNARVLVLTGRNNFEAKKILAISPSASTKAIWFKISQIDTAANAGFKIL